MSRLRELLEEIHRRSLWQVLLVYIGTGYALLQAADLFIDRLDFPNWLFTGTLILLTVGLPIVLLTALLQRRTEGSGSTEVGTRRSSRSGRMRALFTWRNAALGGIVAFALLGAASVTERAVGAIGGRGEEWARSAGMAGLTRLVEEQKWDSAWTVAQHLARVIPGDSAFVALRPQYGRRVSLRTEPARARVYRRFYLGSDTTWEYLGETPLDSIWFPNGYSQIRIEKPGFETLEWAGGWGRFPRGPIRLDASGSLPPGMVRVGGGEVGIQVSDLRYLPALRLGDYLIDRFEVTNRDYRRFVAAGGYERPEYWEHPFTREGRTLSFPQAMALFTDRTGRPGPATWEAGSPPEGEDDYPVAGVSWYEAAAYARFAGKSLPTIYHWYHAAGITNSAYIVPRSNIASRGLAPVGSYRGRGPDGTYDMAGNVREWCLNASGESRYIAGGAWNDPVYLFNSAYTQSPWDRSPINGIRLVQYLDDDDLALAARPIPRAARDFAAERPVSDEVFQVFQRRYAYDRRPLDARVEPVDSTHPDSVRERVSFEAAYRGERVPAYRYLPRGKAPPYQVIVYFPGSQALFAQPTDPPRTEFFDFIVRSGRAVMFPVYQSTHGRGERLQSAHPDGSNAYRERFIQWVQDFSRSIDYLESRPDIDTQKLAYKGGSWGGYMGTIIPAVEPRVKTAVLIVAGLGLQRAPPEVDGFNYAGRIRIPVLMLNGRYDHSFPLETAQLPLFRLLGTPPEHKRHVVSEGGHFVPRPLVIKETLDWLDRYLGPVR